MENIQNVKKVWQAIDDIKKVIKGKDESLNKLMCTMLAGGHILMEDIPGVGKTTLALAFSKALSLKQKRMQFTPDVLPSDVCGYHMYQKDTGKFVYYPGAVMCNLFLADEINRTSPKTQSALLEVMEEGTVTIDAVKREVPQPFMVIATENPTGSSGTQLLPESQLDRFMVCLSVGYPTLENQMKIIRAQRYNNPLEDVKAVTTAENLVEVQQYLSSLRLADEVLRYAIRLCETTREHPLVELGVSPRGISALVKMAQAHAVLEERNYVVPEDVQAVFEDVCTHRMVLRPQARVDGVTGRDILRQIMTQVRPAAGSAAK